MNGRVAKRLRAQARGMSRGQPVAAYTAFRGRVVLTHCMRAALKFLKARHYAQVRHVATRR